MSRCDFANALGKHRMERDFFAIQSDFPNLTMSLPFIGFVKYIIALKKAEMPMLLEPDPK